VILELCDGAAIVRPSHSPRLEISNVASERRTVCHPIGASLLLLIPETLSITGRM
jgi:hypothetical protein